MRSPAPRGTANFHPYQLHLLPLFEYHGTRTRVDRPVTRGARLDHAKVYKQTGLPLVGRARLLI